MTSPIDIEKNAPGPSGARLPALGSPELSTSYIAKIKEIIEILLGRRGGSNWDRAVTFRDLVDMGLSGTAEAGGALTAAIGGQPAQVITPGGPTSGSIENAIRNSASYKRLMTRIGSVEDLANFPEEIRLQLETSISDLARQRQADIQTLQRKQQTAQTSFASQLTEVTAAVQQSDAGVRQFVSSYADDKRAIALAISQLSAELGDVGNINIEERLQALADSVMGLQGQYTIKIQANPVNGKPVFAGIDLAVTSPIDGPGTSSILFLANEFAFVTEDGEAVPFSIAGRRIQFNGDVSINGRVVLGDGVGLPADYFAGTIGGDNLAPNSSFERLNAAGNGPEGFNIYNNAGANEPTTMSVEAGRTGGRSVGISWTNSHYNTKGIFGQMCRGGWIPGKTYMLSVWVKTTNLSDPVGAGVFLAWNTQPAAVTSVQNPPINTIWQRYVFRIVWGAAVEAGGVSFISIATGAGNGNIYFDDLMVVEGDVMPSYSTSTAEALDIAGASALVAAQAQADANAAKIRTDSISSNGVLDRSEKPEVIKEWAAIDAEHVPLVNQANGLGVSYADWESRYYELSNYLSGLYPYWNDVNSDTAIDRGTYNARFNNYYVTRVALLNAFAAKNKAYADAAAMTANWPNIYGPGKPQDNATVGAPAGTLVAGAEAGALVSNTNTALQNADAAAQSAYNAYLFAGQANDAAGAAQQSANLAQGTANTAQGTANGVAGQIPGLSAAIAAKLGRDAHETITGQFSLQSQYALLVGDATNGVWMGSGGIFMVQNGQVKASMPISGDPTFAGRLIAAFGTFGAISIAAGGYLTLQAANYGDPGIFLGFVGTTPKFSIVAANGAKLLYDPSDSQPLKLINVAQASDFSIGITNTLNQYYWNVGRNNTSGYAGAYVAGTANGSGSYSYSWSVSTAGSFRVWIGGSTTSQQVAITVAGGGLIGEFDVYISCTVTDLSTNISKTTQALTVVNFQ